MRIFLARIGMLNLPTKMTTFLAQFAPLFTPLGLGSCPGDGCRAWFKSSCRMAPFCWASTIP